MRAPICTIVATCAFAACASAGTVTFTSVERLVSGFGAGDLGGGCVVLPSVDDTTRFGPWFSSSAVPSFTSGIASQVSTVNPDVLVFGNSTCTLAGVPTCDGNMVASTIDLEFEVTGQVMLIMEGVLSANANAAAESAAVFTITPTGGGPAVYSVVAEADASTPSSSAELTSPFILTAGSYVLHVGATVADAVTGQPIGGEAAFEISINFPVVANDECVDAEPLVIDGFHVFDTSFATTDGPPEAGCAAGKGDDQIEGDVWYVYPSTCDAWLIVSVCGLADFDTRLAVYDGCPADGGTLVACNDDAPDCFGGTSEVLVPVYAGRTYVVRLGGAGGARGTGGLLVTCEIPSDFCEDVLLIGEGQTPYSTVGATTDGPALPLECAAGAGQIHDDIWFTLEASCTGSLRASACLDADFDTQVAIYDGGCPAGNDALLACGGGVAGCADASAAVARVVAGQIVTIRVGGASGEPGMSAGHGTLDVECGVCPADLDLDGAVAGSDLGALLAEWGSDDPFADLDGSGEVDGADLGALLGSWGECR